jgi:hypothetical protein
MKFEPDDTALPFDRLNKGEQITAFALPLRQRYELSKLNPAAPPT